LALGAVGEGAVVCATAISGSGEADEWRLSTDTADLLIAPESEAARTPSGFDQLCRVRGRFAVGGREQTVDCLGHRGSRSEPSELTRFESLRDVSAWFEPDEGVALFSLRPRGAAGQADDVVTAAVFEQSSAIAVTDPRISTTYTAAGLPTRVSLELWLGGGEEEEQEYPRRAAGEAVGTGADAPLGRLDLHLELLRCHSRGREGAGVYVLARAR
jgi:hypothetical protein